MGDRRGVRAFAAVVAVLYAAATLWAAPPRVVGAMPDMAETGVDPGLTEIVITFDQEMQPGGQSICGGGPTFPELTGAPVWRDPRTLVIPVRLVPGKRYDLSINCSAAKNCRSARGEPAEPYPISFRTRDEGETAPALTPEQARACLDELRRAIDERYAYRDDRGLNWDDLFEQHHAEFESAATPAAFARATSRLLGWTGDLHCHVRIGEFVLPGGKRAVDPNFNGRLLDKLVPNLAKPHNAVVHGRFPDGVGYILIAGWGSDPALAAAAHAALDSMLDAPGVIIDVRPNSGGDELVARGFAGRFVAEPAVYSRNQYRDPAAAGGLGPMIDRVVPPTPDRPRYTGRLAVLMGPACMSSCESFLLMMRHGAGAKLIGEKSWGSSGNPKPIELSCGVTVVLSSWRDFEPDGTLLEGRGIEPDVRVPASRQDLQTTDSVLEAGLKEL
ncbi:MAG: hypothetical protein KF869_04200 [Phycisphaeraceae bacterium]|nr:hypothetical protein [Phycisphaeraceae bacterium]